MATNWADDRGLSLTELMVVAMLLGFILAAAWSVMFAVNATTNSLSARAVATDESQLFLDNIARELRQADNLKSLGATGTTNADAQGAFSEIATRSATFYVDLYHDGRAKKVRYYVSGNSLYRQEWASNAPYTYPYTWASTPTSTKVVIKSIDPAWTGSIFTYYAKVYGSGNALGSDPIASTVASVTAVTIQVSNLQTWNNNSASYGASSTVRVRAIGNKF